ncbi:hypothetical protein ABZ890_39740 [Streptomyces sp. NPDC046984]|uniref:hypothetical protein n=1 Tax=Streptomyces sp. NPDC046984 TaxID=3155138 RepID=UPI0033CE0E8D
MADDINLPNLVSHLAVNLDGVSGAVADASRQGSSMGAALGRGVNRELDALLRNLPQVTLNGDSTDLDRDLVRIHRELSQLDSQRIGVDIAIPDALRQIQTLQTQLQRLGDEHPDVNVQASTRQASRQLDELLAAARRVDDTDVTVDVHVDEDRIRRLPGILSGIGNATRSLSGVGATLGKVLGGIGAVVPAAASVVTTLANVAPAAGVAVTGLAAVQLASGTVKLAAVGMEDALTSALDPSKAKDYAEALKKLSPEARKFAEAVHDAAPQLRALQQSVQDRVFRGLATTLQQTSKSVLPVLRTNLLTSATALNNMGTGALTAAKYLADNGTLGKALGSASRGLVNLSGIPAVVVNSLGQIAAAAGPTFERLTGAAGRAAAGIGDKLSAAFESGAMQAAIEHAVDLLKQLADVGGNVFQILGNVFNAVPPGGGGMITVLQSITGALADITGNAAVQAALRTLFTTINTLAETAAPLLAQALQAVAPVITALGPPVQVLIQSLGRGLSPIIDALGPVLVQAAVAFGALVEAAAPLLPVAGQLVAAALPALAPLLDALQTVFEALAPVVLNVATTLQDTLQPILAELPRTITPLASILADNLVVWLGVLGDLLVQLSPSFIQLGQATAELLVACTPLITAVAELASLLLGQLGPSLAPVISLTGQFAAILAGGLTQTIRGVVVPAIQLLSAVLTGDVSGASEAAKRAVSGLISTAIGLFVSLPAKAAAALGPLAGRLVSAANSAHSQMISAIGRKIGEAVSLIGGLPSRAASALGGLGGRLYSAGQSLISGFISGIQSKIPSVKSVLNTLTGNLTSWKGPKQKDAKILTPAGQLLITGFIKGIDDTTAKLRSRLESITKALPANVRSGYAKTLAKATAELQRQVTKRDGVLKKLADAQKKLDDLTKSRSKAAGDITSGILGEANITKGFGDVNSVSAITVGLQQALKSSQAFQANIAKLQKSGLRADLLQQIADAGVEGGAATAAALAKATPTELKKINDLQAQLAKSATATGNTVGDALYGAGIKAAQGLVAGLKSQEKAIEKQMTKIANSMLSTVKKVHKTHSPSRAFADIGVMDGEGLRGGLLSMAAKVKAAAQTVAGAALDVTTGVGAPSFAIPTGPQLATAYTGTAATSGGDNHFHLYGSDATPGGILRALSWQGLVGRR